MYFVSLFLSFKFVNNKDDVGPDHKKTPKLLIQKLHSLRTTNKDLRSIRMWEVPQKNEDREKLLKQNKAEVDESSANIWIK